ncbi:MAG: hypothetical protein QOH70_1956 [Blastocatellia bacterium]|jgi:hypothetical protein|nr:hypothetical protein [Blastocatellia bacterium]
MSSTWIASPATEALAQVLELLNPKQIARSRPETGKEWLITSYREDFEWLWKFERTWKRDVEVGVSLLGWISSGNDSSTRTIIVVWDGTPPPDSTIDIQAYVTPYDWALACSWAIFKRTKSDSTGVTAYPQLRILILDISAEVGLETFAPNAFQAVRAVSWVQVYRPVHSKNDAAVIASMNTDDRSVSLLRSAVPIGSFGFGELCNDLLNPERVLSMAAAQMEGDKRPVLKTLARIWESNLLNSDNRHHVANLMAPLILTQALPAALRGLVEGKIANGRPLRTALKTIVRELGFGKIRSSTTSLSDQGILREVLAAPDVFDRNHNLSFLLIDDQYTLGYGVLLASVLFGNDYYSFECDQTADGNRFATVDDEFRCEANAESILVFLKGFGRVNDWRQPRLLRLDPQVDILFLDLRLWSDSENRRAFLRHLLEVCGSLGIEPLTNAADPSFDSAFKQAYERAQAEVKNGQDGAGEIEPLALFPLLLSHFDASLPIILFSSTHQWVILELVRHRQNIIADFTKPLLEGYAEVIDPARHLNDLSGAINKAIEMHESRCIWERLAEVDQVTGAQFSWTSRPVFEITIPQNSMRLSVYNASSAPSIKAKNKGGYLRTRYDAGSAAPKLNDEELRVLLADYYKRYILSGNSFDFATVPWEMLEGNLIPDPILDDPYLRNPAFDLSDTLDPRNYVARVNQNMRNKKAHGQVKPPHNSRVEADFRLVAKLAFMFLLDFLQDSITPGRVNFDAELDAVENILKGRYPHLRPLIASGKLEPVNLTSDVRVSWIEFAAFLMCFAARNATDGTNTFLSQPTVNAVQRLIQLLSSRQVQQQAVP